MPRRLAVFSCRRRLADAPKGPDRLKRKLTIPEQVDREANRRPRYGQTISIYDRGRIGSQRLLSRYGILYTTFE